MPPARLLTDHGWVEIFRAIRELAGAYQDVEFVYPVHLNPNVQKPAKELLAGVPNIRLCAPMDYVDFVQLMKRAHLILTDSGGAQEEAPHSGRASHSTEKRN